MIESRDLSSLLHDIRGVNYIPGWYLWAVQWSGALYVSAILTLLVFLLVCFVSFRRYFNILSIASRRIDRMKVRFIQGELASKKALDGLFDVVRCYLTKEFSIQSGVFSEKSLTALAYKLPMKKPTQHQLATVLKAFQKARFDINDVSTQKMILFFDKTHAVLESISSDALAQKESKRF